ncbi:sec-independent protein translocase protein TatC [Paenibacillus phyllosphaerae]|uniref:Sec-independent protein translocase protein TatC n=1 Tax=Paenibacillus phyllosphaerae TaxID=274593 RepID=A0A7W5B0F9_9BACL|nr:twin-arginine translocase subunit TatC [Paenibacillus phyllosphaerae]MBB3112088.1 sec-independent protein translocase protein TatC [Paenibacillus phyllosphaerae]
MLNESKSEELSREELAMTLFEHIGELRKRIIYILIVLVLGLILGLFLADPAYSYLMSQEPVNGMKLHALSLWDGIGLYMKFALVIALLFVIPFAFFQLWAFVKPALREREQRAALTFVPMALVLFLGGLSFSYFVVFPMAFNFTTDVATHLGLEETYGVTQYFSFLFSVLIPISLLFELPIVIMFLTQIRILNPVRLRKMRRLAYLILVVLGTMITPPDFISDMLVAVPMIILYEISVFLSGVVYRKQQARDAAWEEEFGT